MLPCITFCPWSAFKSGQYYYKESDFLSNTFAKEEIFEKSFVPSFTLFVFVWLIYYPVLGYGFIHFDDDAANGANVLLKGTQCD
jgi:hypothetical protein